MRRPLRIVLRPAAGPRLGYGHLVRARSLGRALHADVWVSPRGGRRVRELAEAFGLRLIDGPLALALDALRPSVLVIDDPNAAEARRALAAARARGVRVASIHDLGLAPIPSELVVDGSIAPVSRRSARQALLGPRYAVLDPSLPAHRRRPGGRATPVRSILIALGGGPRRRLASALGREVGRALPGVHVCIAGGFGAGAENDLPNVEWLGPRPTLAADLRTCDLAVVAGGMTLYEACAVGTPAVAVAVVPAQAPSVQGFGAAHAACAAGLLPSGGDTSRAASRVARTVVALAGDRERRLAIGRRARLIVDGRGAGRVARAIERLARSRQT